MRYKYYSEKIQKCFLIYGRGDWPMVSAEKVSNLFIKGYPLFFKVERGELIRASIANAMNLSGREV